MLPPAVRCHGCLGPAQWKHCDSPEHCLHDGAGRNRGTILPQYNTGRLHPVLLLCGWVTIKCLLYQSRLPPPSPSLLHRSTNPAPALPDWPGRGSHPSRGVSHTQACHHCSGSAPINLLLLAQAVDSTTSPSTFSSPSQDENSTKTTTLPTSNNVDVDCNHPFPWELLLLATFFTCHHLGLASLYRPWAQQVLTDRMENCPRTLAQT